MGFRFKLSLTVCILLLLVFFIPTNSSARSGCCSHHLGVCGCQCCDGSPLSGLCDDGCVSNYYYEEPTYTCPPHSRLNPLIKGECICDDGYCGTPDRRGCTRLPLNARCVSSPTEAWVCDYGYFESGAFCIKIPARTQTSPETTESPTVKEEPSPVVEQDNSSYVLPASVVTIGTGLLAAFYYKNKANQS